MVVAVAGLPGVGKSTVAGALADRVDGVVLDKDRVRASLFPPSRVEYSHDQNDFCMDVLYRTAGWLLGRDPALTVIIDGCTYTRTEQLATLCGFAAHLGAPLRIIECVCAEDLALARLDRDRLGVTTRPPTGGPRCTGRCAAPLIPSVSPGSSWTPELR